ncbi:MAG TPA: esterase-like activity of phytase family protein [Vicinamibacteria bacterium]|nr:esterase-like activity of phytase family protein [Vicinamibacteria bacterium]
MRLAAPVSIAAVTFVSAYSVPAPPPLALRVTSVPLNAADPTEIRVGGLRYRGGLALRSDAPGFGGLSDVRVLDPRGRFVAISDCGATLTGTLRYDAHGDLAGVGDAELVPLVGPGGKPLRAGEEDAESLAIGADGTYVVGFEGRHRLWRYPAGEAPLRTAPSLLEGPQTGGWLKANQGFEGALFLDGDRLLLVSEASVSGSSNTRAWIGTSGAWEGFPFPLYVAEDAPREPFRPTALAALPGGDVLVLERRYPMIAARLRRVPREAMERRTGLEGTEVARLEPPLAVDNFEGVDVTRDADGRTRVYLLSDDNDCEKWSHRHGTSLQTTLLLSFSLEP